MGQIIEGYNNLGDFTTNKYQNKAFVGKHRQMIFLMQHIRTWYKVSSDEKYLEIESTKVKNQMFQTIFNFPSSI